MTLNEENPYTRKLIALTRKVMGLDMKNEAVVDSELVSKATAKLQKEIDEELLIEDPSLETAEALLKEANDRS